MAGEIIDRNIRNLSHLKSLLSKQKVETPRELAQFFKEYGMYFHDCRSANLTDKRDFSFGLATVALSVAITFIALTGVQRLPKLELYCAAIGLGVASIAFGAIAKQAHNKRKQYLDAKFDQFAQDRILFETFLEVEQSNDFGNTTPKGKARHALSNIVNQESINDKIVLNTKLEDKGVNTPRMLKDFFAAKGMYFCDQKSDNFFGSTACSVLLSGAALLIAIIYIPCGFNNDVFKAKLNYAALGLYGGSILMGGLGYLCDKRHDKYLDKAIDEHEKERILNDTNKRAKKLVHPYTDWVRPSRKLTAKRTLEALKEPQEQELSSIGV